MAQSAMAVPACAATELDGSNIVTCGFQNIDRGADYGEASFCEVIALYWYLVKKNDIRARVMADQHYNRQSPGAPEFTPPGNNIVLIVPSADGLTAAAVWASHRPAPSANLPIPRADGYQYWDNPIFRNESGLQSSELIRQALAVTRYYWRDHLPRDGFHSFVDPRKVRGVKVRGKLVHGFVFYKAGFELYPERTKVRDLLRWIMPLPKLMAIEPEAPNHEQMRLFA